NVEAHVRLGMVVLLISRVMGPFAPEALTRWTVDELSVPAIRWVELYAHRIALASYPGSKLYLLLEDEMNPMGLAATRTRLQALIPLSLPPTVMRSLAGETVGARIKRYRDKAR